MIIGMNNPKLLVLFTILFWSFGVFLTRLISLDSPLLNLSIQLLFLFIFFLLYSLIYYKKRFLQKLLHVKIAYFFFGLFGYFIYYLGMFESFHSFNSASDPAILNYTFPIFTVIFRDLLFVSKMPKTLKVKLFEYGGLSIAFLSIIIVATHGNISTLQLSNIPGLLWGLLAGISYGLFSAHSTSVRTEDQPIFFLAATFISFLISIYFALPDIHAVSHLSISNLGFQAILAFVVNGLGYITWTRANRLANVMHIPISSIASLLYILPFLSLIIISYFLKETEITKSYFLLSLVILIIGTYICQKSESISNFFS